MLSRVTSSRDGLFWIAGIFLGGVVWVRLRLLGVPLERDEGEYAYMAQQWLQGILPYTEAHSMKFPGIYLVYAGVLAILGQTPVAIHLSLLLVNLATACLLFFLGRNLMNRPAAIAAAVSFLVLTLSPALQGFWANAEHFVLPFALGGLLLMRVAHDQPARFFLSGLLLGCAFLIKQHAVFFLLFGALVLIARVVLSSQTHKRPVFDIGWFTAGAIAPLILCVSLYLATGNFSAFWFSTVQYASEYVAMISPDQGLKNFKYVFTQILQPNFPILLLASVGLVGAICQKTSGRKNFFLLGFFLCSFLATTPGFYFRKHYFILWTPALALLAGAGFEVLASRVSSPRIKTLLPAGILILAMGVPVFMQRDFFFALPVFEATRLRYDVNPFPESLEVANYIRDHTKKEDRVAVFGSEPQIYFYSQRKSATRHLYMYPLMEGHAYARRMQTEMIQEITASKPEFIVVVNVSLSWLFQPHSSTLLTDWAEKYVNREYGIAGVVDIFSHKKSIYQWGEAAGKYLPQSSHYLLIYKRRI